MVVNALRAWNDGCDHAVTGGLIGRPSVVPSTAVCAKITAPRSGNARNMFAKIGVTPGVDQNIRFTLFRNGLGTLLSVLISNPAVDGSDIVNEIPVAKGDFLTIVISGTFSGFIAESRVDLELA